MSSKPGSNPDHPSDDRPSDDETAFDSTLDVLAKARQGDGSAARVLIERTVGPLRRWARGRLPYYARAGANTEDVVQDAVLRALARVDHFEHRSVDGMQKYLRESVRNRIRDEVRRVTRRGVGEELPDSLHDDRLLTARGVDPEGALGAVPGGAADPEAGRPHGDHLPARTPHSFEEIAHEARQVEPGRGAHGRHARGQAARRRPSASAAQITPSGASGAADRGGSGRARTDS